MDLQSVKNAIAFCKKALGKADTTPVFAHYVVRDGFFNATDGNLFAACRVNWDADILVPAAEFEAIVNRLPSDPKVEMDGHRMVLRAGRFSGTVLTLPSDVVPAFEAYKIGTKIALTPEFHAKFKKVASFINNADDTSWMTSVNIAHGKMVTTDRGQLMAVVDYPALGDTRLSIPKRAVEIICSKDPPTEMGVIENGSGVFFDYADGSWFRTNVLAGDIPAVVFKRLDDVDNKYNKEAFEITPAWRESYERVAGLSEDEIVLYPDRMEGARHDNKITAKEEAETPVSAKSGRSCYNPKFLNQVVANARWFDPSHYPDATPWWGEDGLRGLIAGKVI